MAAEMAAWLRRLSPADAWYGACSRLLRTKPVGAMAHSAEHLHQVEGAELARVLTTADLVSLGVGSCVGTGMYVVAGLVARNVAGPAVILSFAIAAAASVLSGEDTTTASQIYTSTPHHLLIRDEYICLAIFLSDIVVCCVVLCVAPLC